MATRLITVKSLTNTRGRAYRCLKCPTEVAVIGEKSKVVSHIYKKHTPLDQAPFYCNLCTFRCQYQRDLERHVQYYPAHREKVDQLRELGCPVNEEANLFQNLHPYIPGDNDMEVLGREDSERIWRERSRQGETESHLPPRKDTVQEDSELGAVITLAHPAAPIILADAERSGANGEQSSSVSEVNFLDELLDCGSPINFSVTQFPRQDISQQTSVQLNTAMLNSTTIKQVESHHSQHPRNPKPKDDSRFAEQTRVTAAEMHHRKIESITSVSSSSCSCGTKEEFCKLIAGIDSLRNLMEKQGEMLKESNAQSTALIGKLTAAIHEQTKTYRELNSNITKMIEHLIEKRKQHEMSAEDPEKIEGRRNQKEEEKANSKQEVRGSHRQAWDRGNHQDRRDRGQKESEVITENRRERSPRRCNHRHSPY